MTSWICRMVPLRISADLLSLVVAESAVGGAVAASNPMLGGSLSSWIELSSER